MSAIYLIRHGQAGLRHSYDTLSDLGREQARRLGEYLAAQRHCFSAAYAGSLARQQQTAREVYDAYARAGQQLPELVTDPRWDEFDLTRVLTELSAHLSAEDPDFQREYEALLRDSADHQSELHRRWTRCDTAAVRAWIEGRHPFQGESWLAFRARVEGCLEALCGFDHGQSVAIFTSATPISIWVGLALGLDAARIMGLAGVMYNTAVTTLRIRDGQPVLFQFNTVPHLREASLRTFR